MSDRLKITIRDVARAAGVSVTSVSRHLNGRISLPDSTALKIEQAAARLGYRPNAIARRLTRGSSETLGLITSDIAYPLFAAIASA
ncbi:MAG: LacI family transcriptional regulator, partial [Mesorhizobium sp.]